MAEVLHSMGNVSVPHAGLRSSASHTSFFDSTPPFTSLRKNSYSFSDLRSPSLSSSQTSSVQSTPASSLSLETKFDGDDSSSDDEGLVFPAYCAAEKYSNDSDTDAPPSSPIHTTIDPSISEAPASTPDPLPISEDDTAVRPGPSQHVDYLSHDWKEEDIWSSWRHIVEHRRVYGERSRLENASWRTWAKTQFKLKTTSPESLNWWVIFFFWLLAFAAEPH